LPRKTRSDLNEIVVPDGLGAKMPLGELLRKTHTDAFLVLHRGAIISEQYFFGMRPETPHNLWSVSKSLSVGVVACLMENKTIQENDPITKYIKEWEATAYKDATVRDLLDMQSGVLYNYEPPEMPTWVAHSRYTGTRLKLPGQSLDEGEYDFLASHPEFKQKVREHGEAFYYKESDARGLLWASERATGQRFSDLFSSMIWSKLGAERDAYVCCDGLGSPSTNGRINCTLRDLARWGQMHLNGGKFNGNRILPPAFIDDIPSNADPAKITEDSFPGPRHKNKTLTAYRSQYWIPKDGEGDFTAAGYNGQWCYISPRSQTVIVKFSTYDDDADDAPRFGDMDLAAFQHLLTVVAKS
jgi:CubicO group peptidase (beta-lactamase class C family)